MEHRLLIPTRDVWGNVSGLIEKNVYYCVDFICTFVFQDRDYKEKQELCTLFHVYLDMLIENEDEEENYIPLEDLKTAEVYDFCWQLYNRMFFYLAPMLQGMEWYVYTVNHMEMVYGNLLVHLELDAEESDQICDQNSYRPLRSSI